MGDSPGKLFMLVGLVLVTSCVDAEDDDVFRADRLYAGPCRVENRSLPLLFKDTLYLYDWDAAGNKIGKEYYSRDEDWEGEPRTTTRWEYDDQKLISKTTCNGGCVGGDGTMTYFLYEGERIQMQVSYDFSGGVTELSSRKLNYYDDADNLILVEYDTGEGTAITSRRERQFDEAARLIRVDYDDDADGETDSWEEFHYDENDRLVKHDYDDDADGEIDSWEEFHFDAKGRLVQHDYRVGHKDHDYWEVMAELFAYDDNGFLAMWELDYEIDGVIDYRIQYCNAPFGEPLVVEKDGRCCMCPDPPDGVVDERYLHSYDPFGNLLKVTRDGHDHGELPNGFHDEYWAYDYSCWDEIL